MHTPKLPVRLLHLEDNPRAARLVEEKLRADGVACQIVHVAQPDEFEAAVLQREFDAVLCDYNIPGYDGFSALQRAHRVQPNVPVIFISGSMGDDQSEKSRNMGAAGYLMKHQLDELAPTLKRALRASVEPQ